MICIMHSENEANQLPVNDALQDLSWEAEMVEPFKTVEEAYEHYTTVDEIDEVCDVFRDDEVTVFSFLQDDIKYTFVADEATAQLI